MRRQGTVYGKKIVSKRNTLVDGQFKLGKTKRSMSILVPQGQSASFRELLQPQLKVEMESKAVKTNYSFDDELEFAMSDEEKTAEEKRSTIQQQTTNNPLQFFKNFADLIDVPMHEDV